MAEVVSTNQFRNGMHIELEGQTWRIVEFQHVKPGKGGAFVRTKLKSLGSGSVVDKTFRAGEKFNRIRTETKNMQYLYDAGDDVVFMDEETYEQTSLPRATVEDALDFMQPSSSVQMLLVNGRPSGVQMPASVELAVTETEPGVKGDTVSNVTKPAKLIAHLLRARLLRRPPIRRHPQPVCAVALDHVAEDERGVFGKDEDLLPPLAGGEPFRLDLLRQRLA